jgi:hypothetical protein
MTAGAVCMVFVWMADQNARAGSRGIAGQSRSHCPAELKPACRWSAAEVALLHARIELNNSKLDAAQQLAEEVADHCHSALQFGSRPTLCVVLRELQYSAALCTAQCYMARGQVEVACARVSAVLQEAVQHPPSPDQVGHAGMTPARLRLLLFLAQCAEPGVGAEQTQQHRMEFRVWGSLVCKDGRTDAASGARPGASGQSTGNSTHAREPRRTRQGRQPGQPEAKVEDAVQWHGVLSVCLSAMARGALLGIKTCWPWMLC